MKQTKKGCWHQKNVVQGKKKRMQVRVRGAGQALQQKQEEVRQVAWSRQDTGRCTCLLHSYSLAIPRAKMPFAIPRAKITKTNANSVFFGLLESMSENFVF